MPRGVSSSSSSGPLAASVSPRSGPTRRVRAHAKVNLFLRVLGRRPDGYHEIETVLHAIDLADDVDVSLDRSGISVEMSLGPGVGGVLPGAADDLARRAAELFFEASGRPGGATISLSKHVPIAAGLGGGSADAAAVLAALNDLNGRPLQAADMPALAAVLGSDVPFCLEGGTMLATSRGEDLTPIVPPPPLWLVLGMSHEPLLTPEVYRILDGLGLRQGSAAPMMLALGAGEVEEIAALLHNDLEVAAFNLRPELASSKELLLEAGALGACLSGSGPTLFALTRGEADARAVAAAVEAGFDRVAVTHSAGRVVEPS